MKPARPPGTCPRRCTKLTPTVLAEFEVRTAILASRPEGLQALVDRIAAVGVRAEMTGAIELAVPLEVTLKSGRNWYEVETLDA